MACFRAHKRRVIKNSLQTVTNTTHEALYIWIKNRQNHIIDIAHDETLILLTQKLLQANNDAKNTIDVSEVAKHTLLQLRNFMKKKVDTHQDIVFFIISADKVNIALMRDSNLYETNVIFQKRPLIFNRMLNGETLFIPPINSDVPLQLKNGSFEEGLAIIFIGPPIYDQNQHITALLTLRIDPSYDFSRVTQFGRIGDSGEAYAFDDTGMLLTNSRFEQQLQQIELIPSHGSSMLSFRVTDLGGNMLNGYIPKVKRSQLPLTLMAESAVKGESHYNLDDYRDYRDYRGVPVFGSWI